MPSLEGLEDLAILLVAALVPALIYLTWVRKSEHYDTEPWGPLLGAFAFGAVVATFIAGIIEVVLVSVGTSVSRSYPAPEFTFLNGNSPAGAFFLVIVIAPFVEEAFKAAGVVQRSGLLRMVADGPVVGASVGLGFGFFETLLYGLGAFLSGGLVAGLGLIFVRSISSVLLHGSSTGMFGYGYAQAKLRGRSGLAGGYYLVAVGMHASFNTLASLSAILVYVGVSSSLADDASVLALIAAIFFAFYAISHVRTLIAESNAMGPVRPTIRPARPPGPPGGYRNR